MPRFTPSRVWSCTTSGTRTGAAIVRSCTGPVSRRWSCRTGLVSRVRVPERLRRRRIQPRTVRGAASPRVRLPGRDPLPRRGVGGRARRADDDPERDLRPRGGRRCPVEALGLPGERRSRGSPFTPPRRLDVPHGRELRVRLLLVPLSGRDARLRGEAHRDPRDDGAGAPGAEARFGTLVAPGLVAPNHQHLFCMRLDLDIEGTGNTVFEVDAVALPPGEENPFGTAFEGASTRDRSESRAAAARSIPSTDGPGRWSTAAVRTDTASRSATSWSRTAGRCSRPPRESRRPPGGLRPAPSVGDPVRPQPSYAAGDYPNQSAGGDGLPRWIEHDRRPRDQDIVLWHVFGTSHLPRPEDWPVMPVETAGFTLKPVGFFDRNPSLDVPPPPGH